MGHCGARKGAGRPKGSKTKSFFGEPTRSSVRAAKELERAGKTPLGYIVGVMRETEEYDAIKFMAAKEALPYMHPKLANVTHSGDQDNPVTYSIVTSVDRVEENAKTIEHRKQLELTAEPSDGRYN